MLCLLVFIGGTGGCGTEFVPVPDVEQQLFVRVRPVAGLVFEMPDGVRYRLAGVDEGDLSDSQRARLSKLVADRLRQPVRVYPLEATNLARVERSDPRWNIGFSEAISLPVFHWHKKIYPVRVNIGEEVAHVFADEAWKREESPASPPG